MRSFALQWCRVYATLRMRVTIYRPTTTTPSEAMVNGKDTHGNSWRSGWNARRVAKCIVDDALQIVKAENGNAEWLATEILDEMIDAKSRMPPSVMYGVLDEAIVWAMAFEMMRARCVADDMIAKVADLRAEVADLGVVIDGLIDDLSRARSIGGVS